MLPPHLAILGFVTAVVLAIAYAALDDITTNPQPSHTAEYLWLALTVIWLFVVGRVASHCFRRSGNSRRRGDA
jgi:heme/copper-type cytochrome/quinol oxidase subunit 3